MKALKSNRITETIQTNGTHDKLDIPKENRKEVTITAPNFQTAVFKIIGTAPLVIHRFSQKAKREMQQKIEMGSVAKSKKKIHQPRDLDDIFNESRYVNEKGWDGFHAGSIRCATISACRLVGAKMTLAKLSFFVIADGWDRHEPQIPLVRIYGKAVRQEDMARVETGQVYVTVRAAYHDWHAFVTMRWDADQFTLGDVTNLMARVGGQVGIGEGRPDSKNSAGMGWGTFRIEGADER